MSVDSKAEALTNTPHRRRTKLFSLPAKFIHFDENIFTPKRIQGSTEEHAAPCVQEADFGCLHSSAHSPRPLHVPTPKYLGLAV